MKLAGIAIATSLFAGTAITGAAEPSPTCLAAAHRLLAFVKEEAKGTRHEAQIAATIAEKGEGGAAAGFAATLTDDACTLLVAAPDSTVRAFAISALPERNGQ